MKISVGLWKYCLTVLALSTALLAGAHEGETHRPNEILAEQSKLALEEINEKYLHYVKPIFQNKCFDCHSSQIREPWYRTMPGAKQLIDSDIQEAKEHLNMDPDFPFQSHATPLEDLKEIEKSVLNNKMPPWRYKLLHPRTSLNQQEKDTIVRWTQAGQNLLRSKN